jgi:hypothetical protein
LHLASAVARRSLILKSLLQFFSLCETPLDVLVFIFLFIFCSIPIAGCVSVLIIVVVLKYFFLSPECYLHLCDVSRGDNNLKRMVLPTSIAFCLLLLPLLLCIFFSIPIAFWMLCKIENWFENWERDEFFVAHVFFGMWVISDVRLELLKFNFFVFEFFVLKMK